jgi:hypothetical protein
MFDYNQFLPKKQGCFGNKYGKFVDLRFLLKGKNTSKTDLYTNYGKCKGYSKKNTALAVILY